MPEVLTQTLREKKLWLLELLKQKRAMLAVQKSDSLADLRLTAPDTAAQSTSVDQDIPRELLPYPTIGEREVPFTESLGNFLGGALGGLIPIKPDVDPTGSFLGQLAYKLRDEPAAQVGEVAGEVGQYVAGSLFPPLRALRVLGGTSRAAPLLGRMARSATLGGGLGAVEQAGNIGTDEFDPLQAPIVAASFAAFDAVFAGLGKAGRGIAKLYRAGKAKQAVKLYDQIVKERLPEALKKQQQAVRDKMLREEESTRAYFSIMEGSEGAVTKRPKGGFKQAKDPLISKEEPLLGTTMRGESERVSPPRKKVTSTGSGLLPGKPKTPALDVLSPKGVVGGLYGFEKDDQGNITFDPKKGLIGLGAGLAGASVLGSKSGRKFGHILLDKTKPARQLFIQFRNKLTLPESKQIGKEILVVDEKYHRSVGGYIEDLRGIGLKFSGMFGKLSEKNGKLLADALDKTGTGPVSAEWAKKANGVRELLLNIWKDAKQVGLGPGYIQNYFPRVWQSGIADQVYNDLAVLTKKLATGTHSDRTIAEMLNGRSEATRKIITHLLETKQASTYADAIKKLETRSAQELYPEVSFLQTRTLDLPSWVFERDAGKVLPKYINDMSKMIEEARMWGPRAEKAAKLIESIKAKDAREGAQVEKLMLMGTGQYDRLHGLTGARKTFIDAVTSMEFVTKIGLGMATIPNITQTMISTMFELGLSPLMRSGLKLFSPSRVSWLRRSGIMNQSMLHSVMGGEVGGIWKKFADVSSHASGFTGINKANLYIAASTFEVAVKDWMKLAQRNTLRGRWARKRLSDFGIDHTTPLTDNLLSEKMYRFATDSQLQKNILNDPTIANEPWARVLALFKRFGYRQFVKVKDELIKEIGRGNVLPALRLGAGGYLGGEFVVWSKNKIREFLTGEPQYRTEDMLSWERFANNYAAVGSLGFFTDLFAPGGERPQGGRERGPREDFASSLEFQATPVVISDMIKAGVTARGIARDWDKYGPSAAARRAVPEAIGKLGSLPRAAGRRLRTESVKEEALESLRGFQRTKILDLQIAGDEEQANKLRRLWNENHPEQRFKSNDFTAKERNARRKMLDRKQWEAGR